jgi:hypothetical protein
MQYSTGGGRLQATTWSVGDLARESTAAGRCRFIGIGMLAAMRFFQTFQSANFTLDGCARSIFWDHREAINLG